MEEGIEGKVPAKMSMRSIQKAAREAVIDLMDKKNYNPFLELIELGKDTTTPANIRANIATHLSNLVVPQLKSVDVEAKMDGHITVKVQQFVAPVIKEIIEGEIIETKELENNDNDNEPS